MLFEAMAYAAANPMTGNTSANVYLFVVIGAGALVVGAVIAGIVGKKNKKK